MILTIGCDACGKVIPNEETYVCGIVGNRFAHYHDAPECHPESYRSLDRVTESVTSSDNNNRTYPSLLLLLPSQSDI